MNSLDLLQLQSLAGILPKAHNVNNKQQISIVGDGLVVTSTIPLHIFEGIPLAASLCPSWSDTLAHFASNKNFTGRDAIE